jgi:hypothetical protein
MKVDYAIIALTGILLLGGCVNNGTRAGAPATSSSERANVAADQTMYRPVDYVNRRIRGPAIVVLPGKIKSNNASFAHKVTPNNIADYGELELGKANFRVLERSDLGPMLDEISLAVNMGDSQALSRFRRGKFKSTQWFVEFDVLKAEPAVKVGTNVSGEPIADMLRQAGANSYLASTISSIRSSDEVGVWVIGLKYKLMDARTSEQVATNYFERKMEVGSTSVGFLGVQQRQEGGLTLDSMVHRLVQLAVQDIDGMKASSRGSARRGDSGVASVQKALNAAGYDAGPADGLMGAHTRAAIRAFQQDRGLEVTGRLDDETRQMLNNQR